TERENIRQRRAEGIAAAKARGVRFGHPPMDMREGFEELKRQWTEGKITSRQAGKLLGVSYQTFLRRVKGAGKKWSCFQKGLRFQKSGQLPDGVNHVIGLFCFAETVGRMDKRYTRFMRGLAVAVGIAHIDGGGK